MIEMGILDPTKVTRLALQNAASVAALFLTTEASICEVAKEAKSAIAMPLDGDVRHQRNSGAAAPGSRPLFFTRKNARDHPRHFPRGSGASRTHGEHGA